MTIFASIATFSCPFDSNAGLASYLSCVNSKTKNEITIVSKSSKVSAFGLPGTSYELNKKNKGVKSSYVFSELNDDTFDHQRFYIEDVCRNLNLVSYTPFDDKKNVEDCLDVKLICGTITSNFLTEKSFYISESSAKYFIDALPSVSNYDELLNLQISYESQLFSILGIFRDDSAKTIFKFFKAVNGSSSLCDFIICPYYLMNGGYFSHHNSLLVSLTGNESVFYYYLNFMSKNWRHLSVSQQYFSYSNDSFNLIEQSGYPFTLFSSLVLHIILPFFGFICITILFFMMILVRKKQKLISNQLMKYLILVLLGLISSAVLLKLLNGVYLGNLFLYFCNYSFVLIELLITIALVLFCLAPIKIDSSKYYSLDI